MTQLLKISIVLIALIWLSTFILSVPIHGKLATGKDSELINKLIITNRSVQFYGPSDQSSYFLYLKERFK